ncbi:MAG TPA: hypothetical protein VGC41_20090 [Kofleriaceae bacterium]
MTKLIALLFLVGTAHAQRPDLTKQKAAMAKLGFLAGTWSGPANITRGPTPTKITQTEVVESQLDGTVLAVHGTGRDATGKVVFEALATIAYDEATSTYRIRAYNDGHYVDEALKVGDKTFDWGFGSQGFAVANAMHLTAKGEWAETTMVTIGTKPATKAVDMVLAHQK